MICLSVCWEYYKIRRGIYGYCGLSAEINLKIRIIRTRKIILFESSVIILFHFPLKEA